jgi:hypothetical protein
MAKKKTTLKGKLAKLGSDWEASEPKRAGMPLPDGEYVARIDEAVLNESRASGRLQVTWKMTCMGDEDGNYEGRKVSKFSGLDSVDSLSYFMGDLESLEIEAPDDISDIGETLEEAAGIEVIISIWTRDEFTNISFKELAETSGEEGGEEEAGEEPAAEEGAEEGEELTEEDVDEMDKSELLELIKEEELEIKTKGKKAGALRKAVKEALFEEE